MKRVFERRGNLDDALQHQSFSRLHLLVLGLDRIGFDLESCLNFSLQSINALDKNGRSPLYWAMRRGDNASASTLIRHGASPRVGESSMAWTCKGLVGNFEGLQLLLSAGADPNGHDRDGHAPLHACGIFARDEEF
jgi:ankyrin repeat protein